LNSRELIIIRE